jgi:cob(I)alamin adenosyltransferase
LKNLGILETDIELLENEIDSMENELQMTHLSPGATLHMSHCHDATAVQAYAVHLSHNEPVAEIAIKYLNRLSDYLFVLSQDLSAEEVKWIPRIIRIELFNSGQNSQ